MKIAAIQTIEDNGKEATLAAIVKMIEDTCRNNDITFLLLPNNLLNQSITEEELPNIVNLLKDQAKTNGIYLIGGTIEVTTGDNIYETSYIINPEGTVIDVIQKNQNDGIVDDINVIETEYGKIGVLLGEDIYIPEIPRILCLKGAEILFVSANSPIDHLQAIWGSSVLNCVCIVYSNSVTKNSIIAIPGQILAKNDNQDTLTEAVIENNLIQSLREPDIFLRNTFWWCLWGRKPELYHLLKGMRA